MKIDPTSIKLKLCTDKWDGVTTTMGGTWHNYEIMCQTEMFTTPWDQKNDILKKIQ